MRASVLKSKSALAGGDVGRSAHVMTGISEQLGTERISYGGNGRKLNCWEFKNCQRQPGGAETAEFGVCPAAVDESSEGVNSGVNAGRYCWKVSGTFCGGKVQGAFAQKAKSCATCDFFKTVKMEEGSTLEI
jgi:hypothetical protein